MARRINNGLIALIIFATLLIAPASAQSDPWPPFFLNVFTFHEDGLIKYDMRLSKRVDWQMSDVRLGFPLPPGTRFVEANAQATTTAQLEGDTVVFFTSVFHRPLRNLNFTLEITDPSQTMFTTQAKVNWIGDQPGEYTTNSIVVDTTQEYLDWGRLRPKLSLGFVAEVTGDDTITYLIYPQNFSVLRMWDVRLNLRIPDGTRYLSMEAQDIFGTEYDGQEARFFVSELAQGVELEPLKVTVSTEDIPDGQVVPAQLWASWKNAGRFVALSTVLEEQLTFGTVYVQPRTHQRAVADYITDVPLDNYDLTSVSLTDNGSYAAITLYTMGDIQPDEPIEYQFYIDLDCSTTTGQFRDGRGGDLRLRFRNQNDQTQLIRWDDENQTWLNREAQVLTGGRGDRTVNFTLPYSLVDYQREFCWTALVRNDTKQYTPRPPAERVPNSPNERLTVYRATNEVALTDQIDAALSGRDMVIVPIETEVKTEVSTKPEAGDQPQTAEPLEQTAGTDDTPGAQDDLDDTVDDTANEDEDTESKSENVAEVIDRYISLGDEWRYQPGWSALPANWNQPEFDDQGWYRGPTSLGYGDGDYNTDLSLILNDGPTLQTNNGEQADETPALDQSPPSDFTSVFLRRSFDLRQTADLTQLTFEIDYEDGFIAYLNGVEVTRRGLRAPGTDIPFDATATDRDPGPTSVIDLTEHLDLLNDGTNVIALQVHRALGRSNLFVGPALRWERNGDSLSQPETTTSDAPVSPVDDASTPMVEIEPTLENATPEPTNLPTPTSPSVATPTDAPSPTATPKPSGPVFVPEQPGRFSNLEQSSTDIESDETDESVSVEETEVSSATPTLDFVTTPVVAEIVPEPTPQPTPTEVLPVATLPARTVEPLYFPEPDPNPAIIDVNGKIAVPVDNGGGRYDVHVFTLRFGYGWETHVLEAARQPHFRMDDQYLLVNRQGDGLDNIYEYSFIDGSQRQISDRQDDAHPIYDPFGNRVAYANNSLDIDPNGVAHPLLVVQCSTQPPHLEGDRLCREIGTFGILIPAGQVGRIAGTHPVWASNDQIIYKGCDSWLVSINCGIYTVSSGATKAYGDGVIPMQLTSDLTDIPSDTKGPYVVMTSQREGNWEAYLMGLDGSGLRNLSNSPGSNDGLPTISPDGNWVAFVSDRDGGWGVWAAPLVGGRAQKLFALPSPQPWGEGDRAWTNERIAWGR